MSENKDSENSSFNNEEYGRNSSSSDKLNQGYMDITLNSSYGSADKKSKVNTDFLKNKDKLDAFLQGAYSRTVAVSHNYSCTFHSMGRNILEMYLEDKKSNVSNGLGERIIKKLLEKHGNKLKNPIWAHAGWHPSGSFAYRKSFWESVKYYFSNATWGWLNLFNPFFWLSELIWGEYKNDIYQYKNENKNEIKLLIGESLYESEKYRIGNILGQLIREEIAVEVGKLRNKGELLNNNKNITEEETNDGFTDITMKQKVSEDTSGSKNFIDTIFSINMVVPGKKFDELYISQESSLVAYEWQYLTSKDFLEEQKNEEEKQNGELSKTIIFEVKNKKIVFSEGNEVSNYCLSDDKDMEEIKSKLDIKTQKVASYLVCVMSSGFSMGRCQPIVGTKNKNEFINEFIKVLETNNETTYDYLNSSKNERMNDNSGNTKNEPEK